MSLIPLCGNMRFNNLYINQITDTIVLIHPQLEQKLMIFIDFKGQCSGNYGNQVVLREVC